MAKSVIPYGKQEILPSDIETVAAVLDSDYLTCGPQVAEFERKLCEVTGARYAIACANGTAALHLACLALDIAPGSRGVTSPITFLASANCIEYCGGRADFVDIDETLCLSPALLREYCEKEGVPSVVVAVDFAGVTANLPAISALSREFGFRVIEDAAHSLGSTYHVDGKTFQAGCCVHSDCAILSFHPVKTVTTGEGGALLTNDRALAERLRTLRTHGMIKNSEALSVNGPWYYEMHELGFNYRITDLQCALGISQLARLPQYKKRRQDIVKRYNEAFSELEDALQLPPWPENSSPCFHLYPMRFRGGSEVRALAYHELQSRGIQTQVHYIPVYWQPYYANRYGYRRGMCPAAEHYYSQTLSLPLFPALTDAEVDFVIASVREVISKLSKDGI